MTRILSLVVLLTSVSVAVPATAQAQDPTSAAPAKELAKLLADRKLDSFAARLPDSADEFAATLTFPGQLIVVWARFSAPRVLNEKILKGEFREVYIDLNSASEMESRHFITDLGADGLQRGDKNEPADSHDIATNSMRFDGDWREDKMSEAQYMKAYAEADAAYTRVLGVLLDEIKKGR